MDRQRRVRGEQARIDERPHQQQERRRVATGIGDALRRADRFGLPGCEFGQAVDPAFGDAMRGARIENPHGSIVRPGGGFASRVVRQTQNGDVRCPECRSPRSRILALGLRERREFDIGAALQQLADAQAGGADGAVEEDPRSHDPGE